MVDFFVEKRAKGRAGATKILRVDNYVRLSRGQDRIYIQGGVLQYEDGTPLPADERAGWQPQLDTLTRAMQVACGLVAPSSEAQRAPEVPAVWLFGATDDADVYIRGGQFFTESGQPIDPEDIPLWVHGKLATMDNRERLRAGLLPINARQARAHRDRDEPEDPSTGRSPEPDAAQEEPTIDCPQCGQTMPERVFDRHCDTCTGEAP